MICNKKNIYYKIMLILVFGILIFLIIPNKSNAVGLSISTSKSVVEPGENFNVTISANGLVGRVKATVSNGKGVFDKWLENNSESFICTAGSSGEIKITASGDISTTTNPPKDDFYSVSKVVKIAPKDTPKPPQKSDDANLSNLGIKPHDFNTFRSATTSYDLVVPNDVSRVNIYAKAHNNKATISGTGYRDLKIGHNTFNVICTAENGKTKTYTLNITRKSEEEKPTEKPTEKPVNSSDALLSSLTIVGIPLSESFDAKVNEYTVQVLENVTNVNIEATPSNEKANVLIEGGKDLVMGENIAKITVTAEDGTINVYTLKIIKTANKMLLETLIIGYLDETGKFVELSTKPKFSPEIFNYTIIENIEYNINELKIDAITNTKDIEVEIKGNNELKEGKNTITIILKKKTEDEINKTEQIEYKIIVNKQAKPVEPKVGIVGMIKNTFTGMETSLQGFVDKNKKTIIVSALGFCSIIMIGLSIYVVIDYKKYKIILNKITKLTQLTQESSITATSQEMVNNEKEVQSVEKIEKEPTEVETSIEK